MTFQIHSYNNIDKKKWGEFVRQNPNGNFFQTPELYEIYKQTKNYYPLFLAVTDQNEILALLLAVKIQEFTGLLGKFSSRSVIQGGPIFQDSDAGREALIILLTEYDKIAKKNSIYTEIRNTCDQSLIKEIFIDRGYEFKNHLNILVDLKKSKDDLWAGLGKSRRRFIRKTKEIGVVIEEMKSNDLIPVFYELLKKTYKNAKQPLADISLFHAAFKDLSHQNLIKFFLVKYGDEYIGGIMTPLYNGVITEWYITSSRRHSKLYPSDAITWHPIEWGADNGYSVFDFGGAGIPEKEYGVRDFKKQFGGELVNWGRYLKIYAPKKMWIAQKGLEVWRNIWV
jgi:serine/alanine adding enzyme